MKLQDWDRVILRFSIDPRKVSPDHRALIEQAMTELFRLTACDIRVSRMQAIKGHRSHGIIQDDPLNTMEDQ